VPEPEPEVPGCSSVLAGKLCTNEAIGAANCSAVNRVRMSVPTWPAPNKARYRRRVLERRGHSNVQCSSSCNALGARHQGHALRDLGTLGLACRGRSMCCACHTKLTMESAGTYFTSRHHILLDPRSHFGGVDGRDAPPAEYDKSWVQEGCNVLPDCCRTPNLRATREIAYAIVGHARESLESGSESASVRRKWSKEAPGVPN
jgi:hypothetical protein